MAVPKDWMKLAGRAGWDILSAMLGDILASLKEEAPVIIADRVKRTFTERRKEFIPFLEKMREKGGDYATAADHLFALMETWQGKKPGEEGWKMKMLVDELYGGFDLPEKPTRPERPVIPAGKGGGGAISAPALEAYKLDLQDYKDDLQAWKGQADARDNLRLEFFKQLGLKSDREIDVILEAVRDNGFWQLVMALPIYEMKQASRKVKGAAKKSWQSLDTVASHAARPGGFLDGLVNQLEDYARVGEVEVIEEDDPDPLELEGGTL